MPTENTMIDDLKEAVTNNDKPLGTQAPGAPFAVVALTYLLVLMGAMAVLGLCVWAFT